MHEQSSQNSLIYFVIKNNVFGVGSKLKGKFMQTKIAIVTGGRRGLGKNAALNLAQKGIDVILTYHSNRLEADPVVDQIKKSGRRAAALQLDVSKVASFAAFVETVQTTLKNHLSRDRFDFLINNAGTCIDASFMKRQRNNLIR